MVILAERYLVGMLQVIIAIFSICLAIFSFAEEISDGLWNGKPWEKAELEEAVAFGDAQALAEWAYWSRVAWGGVKPDQKKLFLYATRSAALGNPMGQAILARCYLEGEGVAKDEEGGLKLAHQAAEAGHPLGLKNLANCHFGGQAGLEIDLKKGNGFEQEAMDGGCVIARENCVRRIFYGFDGHVRNKKSAFQMAIPILMEKHSNVAAEFILQYAGERAFQNPAQEELIKKAEERLMMGVKVKHLNSMVALGRYYSQVGRADEGMPLILEAAQNPHFFASTVAHDFAIGEYNLRRAGTIGETPTIYRLARESYSKGNRHFRVLDSVAKSYLYPWENHEVQPEKAKPIIDALAETQSAPAHVLYGVFFCMQKNNRYFDRKRGHAHFFYSASKRGGALYGLVQDLAPSDALEKGDIVSAYAANYAAIRRNQGSDRSKLMALQKRIEKLLSPEQMKEAKDLIKRGYPLKEEFQKAAIETLKEYGDLPPDAAYTK